jgi:hypothetical protein
MERNRRSSEVQMSLQELIGGNQGLQACKKQPEATQEKHKKRGRISPSKNNSENQPTEPSKIAPDF